MVAVDLQLSAAMYLQRLLPIYSVFATLSRQMGAINLQVPAANVFEIFAMNLKLFRYVVLANGCYQFAVIRGNVLANGCYQFAGNCQHCSSKFALANGCYQLAPSSLQTVLQTGRLRYDIWRK